MYLKTLDEIDSVKKIFPFLIKNDFVGYLNYGLLKEISELVENTEVKEKFDRYESEYKHLLNASTFNILMQVFHDYPDLSPTTAVGLPEIMFRLESPWPEGSILTWQEYLKARFPNWADSLAPKEYSNECIIVTYAILPSALPAALKDLRDPAVLKELEDIGVTVLQLPDVLKNGNESTGILTSIFLSSCILIIISFRTHRRERLTSSKNITRGNGTTQYNILFIMTL